MVINLKSYLKPSGLTFIFQELKQTLYTTKAGMQFMQMKLQEEFNNLGKVQISSSELSLIERTVMGLLKLRGFLIELSGLLSAILCRSSCSWFSSCCFQLS